MASRRIKLAAASALVIGVGGYWLYSVFAVQGSGILAQAPLNVQSKVPPAFIMAVDDSGSMTFETLFPGRDGQAFWDNATYTTNGFFNSDGTLRTAGDTIDAVNDSRDSGGSYNHLLPFVGHRIDNGRFAIPPIDNFGFARSPEFNPAYFNPNIKYEPWRKPDADNVIVDYPQASPTKATPEPDPDPTKTLIYTFDLTAVHTDRTDDTDTVPTVEEMFIVPDDASLPEGTKYFISGSNSCGGLGTSKDTRNTWVTVGSGGHRVTDDCQMGIAYVPATFYLKTTSPDPPGYVDGRGTAKNACGPGCDMYRYEINSTMFGDAAEAMQKNFANWFTYYGDRNRSMIAGLTRSLDSVQDMRVGMFTINSGATSCGWNCTEYTNYPNVVMRDMNTPADKAALFRDQLLKLPASGSTPNRWAVEHLGKQFDRKPVKDGADNDNLPIRYSCQKNAGMLFTDGYSNQGGPGVGDVDKGTGAPYSDAYASTMADISAKYYLADLRDDLPKGNVPLADACSVLPLDTTLDCRTNLHMNFYGITLGAKGNLIGRSPYIDNPLTIPNEATKAAFASAPAWQARENDQPSTVDEIWHASINGRGEYVNATTPADITAAMRRVIASINAGRTPSGSIAMTGARIGTGSLSVSPFYEARNDGTDWYSTLTAQTVSSDPVSGVVTFKNAWEASTRLPAPDARNVWFTNSAGTVVPFDATNVVSLNNLCNNPHKDMSVCTGALIEGLTGSATTKLTLTEALAYLKGDQTKEVGRTDTGILRFRTTRLGDIVNSTPVVSSPRDDFGYRSLPEPYSTSYGEHLKDKLNQQRTMIYAGANDGMLHAFDGRETEVGGIERFAYIPNSVLGHMGNLLFPLDPAKGGDQIFQHRFYVDGPLAVSDAYYSSDWQTVLVGTTGAGARGVFALDVSRASRPSADGSETGTFAASDRLWEINDVNTALPLAVRENIGNVLNRPVIVPVKTGDASGPVKWRAIFGNGYNSISKKAVLFLVDIDTGAPNVTMIEATEDGAPSGDNGLGNLVVVDRWGPATDSTLTARVRDGFADTVYAADQKGAIWKFDLRDAKPANITKPMFTTLQYTAAPDAGKRQPILGGLTAAAGPGGGVLVYFGTGSFSFIDDATDTALQSLYAVLDNGGTDTVTRSNLLEQRIITTENGVREISANLMGAGLKGWYLDLPAGERFVAYPRIESGVVFMPTYAPNASVGCGAAGNNWLYGLNALSGAPALSNVRKGAPDGESYDAGTGALALNTGGTAPVKDVAVMTSPRIKPLGTGATDADLTKALGAQCSMVVQVAGAPPLYLPRACGRQSWRQIQ
ncbi:PilC/PilY family type IV pilus protein [Luteimonas sp. SX5]|uniref:PilC/PilY family type IV pilus protein n=1 Tax=Luteimonas galliterrae TaxID=2940486 RepID=A0ABT0MJS7_9GAMM|nr:PilC/PilY family type IV pilus protein [Luteimonas galliterrae]MCL1635126.1 PilC/PilY family type IV pilus protein [Luteimonas galliterrae]